MTTLYTGPKLIPADSVTPDMCCGSKLYASETGKHCCTDKLYDPNNYEACCGSIIYNKNYQMCCDPGVNGHDPRVEFTSTGCNFGSELENTSGVIDY